MNRSRALLLAAVPLLVAAAGCRRKSSPDAIEAAPRPVWSVSEISTVEGRRFQVTLTLSRSSDTAAEVSLSSDTPADILFPDTVTFPAGDVSEGITFTAVAAEPGPMRDVLVIASTPNGSSELRVHITDDDADLGIAIGPVAWGPGVAVFSAAGIDGLFGTADDEFAAARNIGSGTPVLASTPAPTLSGTDLCRPVVAPGGIVLVLASGTVPTILQVTSIPDAPAVNASLALPAKPTGVSRPVMVGSRAVVASRGSDTVTSADDALLVVEGIGSATLTVKTVLLPGLAPDEPSVPVPLGDTSLLVTTSGPDFLFGTGDEVLVVVSGLDTASPVATPVFAGFIRGDATGRPVASGGTIAAVCTAGPDSTFGTDDDTLQVVRDVLGSPTPALPLTLGPVSSGGEALPLSTGGDEALVLLLGTDLVKGTMDDELAVASSLSADPMFVAKVPAGRSLAGAEGGLVLLSSGAAVRLDPGVDGTVGTQDDGLRLFTLLSDPSPSSTTVSTGPLQPWAPMAVDGGSAALCGAGADHTAGTGDDVTIRVAGIGGSAAMSSNPTGAFAPLGKPALIFTSAGRSVAARTSGPDATGGTADDRLSVAVSP